MKKLSLAALLAAGTLAAGCATTSGTAPAEVRGGVLTDWYSHKTLYTCKNDTTDKSNCNGFCETRWPPLRPAAGERAGDGYTLIKRDDGSSQWAYKGKPLYFFVGDSTTGDKKGDGVNGNWETAKP